MQISVSTRQASALLDVHESSVKRWCNAEELACWLTPGGHRRIPIVALVAFAHEQSIHTAALRRPLHPRRAGVVGGAQQQQAGPRFARELGAARLTCVVCGREMQWRKRWARNWDHVRYCSRACRKNKVQPIDFELEEAILTLLHTRKRNATIPPSEAARAVRPGDAGAWRTLLEPTGNAARHLAGKGLVEIIQQGRVVDPSKAFGAIRLRLVRSS